MHAEVLEIIARVYNDRECLGWKNRREPFGELRATNASCQREKHAARNSRV